MKNKDDLGDRIKSYEAVCTSRRAFKGQPIVCRIDGKAFHTFTKGLAKPYDTNFLNTMQATLFDLVKNFNPVIGYTQSDEINLVWYVPAESNSEYPFNGRFQKFDSVLASATTVFFNRNLGIHLPTKQKNLPMFDCRTFVVPNLQEAYHVLLWRQQDATKNAIQSAAYSMFSHKAMHGLNTSQLQEKMFSEKGVNFNDYPWFFKRGVFARRVVEERQLTIEELSKIPPNKLQDTSLPVRRTSVELLDIWLSKQVDPVGVIFNNEPIIEVKV